MFPIRRGFPAQNDQVNLLVNPDDSLIGPLGKLNLVLDILTPALNGIFRVSITADPSYKV